MGNGLLWLAFRFSQPHPLNLVKFSYQVLVLGHLTKTYRKTQPSASQEKNWQIFKFLNFAFPICSSKLASIAWPIVPALHQFIY